MGLFDLFRKAVGVADELEKFSDTVTRHTSAGKSLSGDCYSFRGTPEEYFARLFAEYFPECSVQRNVRMNLLTEEAVPVTFMLYKGGRQRLAVILCDSHDYKRRDVMNTIRACEALRIPTQRYFTNFRNELNYVRNRAGQALQ